MARLAYSRLLEDSRGSLVQNMCKTPNEVDAQQHFHAFGRPIFQIVGVAADHKVLTVGEPPTPFFHVALSQRPNTYSSFIARTGGDANTLLRDMRRELLAMDPNLGVRREPDDGGRSEHDAVSSPRRRLAGERRRRDRDASPRSGSTG